jgi:hypothetical protein
VEKSHPIPSDEQGRTDGISTDSAVRVTSLPEITIEIRVGRVKISSETLVDDSAKEAL